MIEQDYESARSSCPFLTPGLGARAASCRWRPTAAGPTVESGCRPATSWRSCARAASTATVRAICGGSLAAEGEPEQDDSQDHQQVETGDPGRLDARGGTGGGGARSGPENEVIHRDFGGFANLQSWRSKRATTRRTSLKSNGLLSVAALVPSRKVWVRGLNVSPVKKMTRSSNRGARRPIAS